MAIPHINPDDRYRAGFRNGNIYPNFDMADHGSFIDQQG
jgi:hypothetical protein